MYVCMLNVCMYVCMSVCMYVCMSVCVYVNMYVCIIKAGKLTLSLCFKDPLILISIAGMTAKVVSMPVLFLFVSMPSNGEGNSSER